MSGDNEHKEISKAQHEAWVTEIRQGVVAYVEQSVADFVRGVSREREESPASGCQNWRVKDNGLVTKLEGERQRTVKEWCTFMGQPTEYGDNILLQAIALHLKKPVQVFSWLCVRSWLSGN